MAIQELFDLVLLTQGTDMITTSQTIRDAPEVGNLTDAMELVKRVPSVVLQGVSRERASTLQQTLESVGATARIQPHDPQAPRIPSTRHRRVDKCPACGSRAVRRNEAERASMVLAGLTAPAFGCLGAVIGGVLGLGVAVLLGQTYAFWVCVVAGVVGGIALPTLIGVGGATAKPAVVCDDCGRQWSVS